MSKTDNIERKFAGCFIPHKLNDAEIIRQKEKCMMRSDLFEFEKL